MDKDILAPSERIVPTEEKRSSCFYCLSGWVFLGSIDHDGEEVIEAIRCRRCGGTGSLADAAGAVEDL